LIFSLAHTIGTGAGAATIAARVESAIADGRLARGERLPAVRELAAALAVSPATVAAAYRLLRQRGLVSANRRRGTVVAPEPPLRVRAGPPPPPHVRDLASGNPDPAFLPPLAPALERLATKHVLYGAASKHAPLVELARADFAADGIAGEIAIAGGAVDAIDRLLSTQLRPGDRVAVEDPCWPRITDLLYALVLEAEPVRVDERGLVPDELERALRRGARAVVVTPRGQNPLGGALDHGRSTDLLAVLERHPDVLVVEDDYAGAVAGATYVGVHAGRSRWAVVRSLSKVLGPDLRVAPLAGDALTVGRFEGRQLLGPGWVSHLLQQTAALLWTDPATTKLLARASGAYAERRAALVEALAARGIRANGRSGLGVWIPLADEAAATQLLFDRGFAVSPGERFRTEAPPGVRVTTTTLQPAEAQELAEAVDEITSGAGGAGYTG